MYPNLEAEMAREKVTRKDIAELLSVRHATIIDKLNGKYRLYLNEAKEIQAVYFPHLTIEYLFVERQEEAS